MLTRGQQLAFHWPSKNRMPWLLLALASMFTSAYSVFRLMGVVASISWRTGPDKQIIPELQKEGDMWLWLALVLPFLAALLLGMGKKEMPTHVEASNTASLAYPPGSRGSLAPIARYGARLAISLLGTLGFALCLFLVGLALHKLGIHSN